MNLLFVRWASSRKPKKAYPKEGERNQSKWHLTQAGDRTAFCGAAIHASAAPVRPEYTGVLLAPLRLPEGEDEGKGICLKCAASVKLGRIVRNG